MKIFEYKKINPDWRPTARTIGFGFFDRNIWFWFHRDKLGQPSSQHKKKRLLQLIIKKKKIVKYYHF